jgi:hypothetical protein
MFSQMILFICVLNTTYLWGKHSWKIKIKFAAIEDLETPPEDMSVQGRDLLTGKPKQVEFLIEKLLSIRQINSKNWGCSNGNFISNTSWISSRYLQHGYLPCGWWIMLRGLDKEFLKNRFTCLHCRRSIKSSCSRNRNSA